MCTGNLPKPELFCPYHNRVQSDSYDELNAAANNRSRQLGYYTPASLRQIHSGCVLSTRRLPNCMFKANKIRPRPELYANHRELLTEVILLTILHSIHDMTISDEFCDPTDGHFAVTRVGELLVVSNQMLLVPRIFFHSFIVVDTLKYHLTEAIVVRQIGHLGIDQFAHQLASL
jgi:hypothetical protein